MRSAHRAEVRNLRPFGGQRFVVEGARRFGIEREFELVLPAELETRAAQDVVPVPRVRMAFGDVGGVRRNLIGDHAVFDVLLVGQTKMFFRRDVAEHRRPVPADHRRADGARDMVVTRSDVGDERAERIERRLFADLELAFHVLLDEVHRNVTRAFDDRLDVVLPGDLGQFAERVEFGELRLVVGVGGAAGSQSITERERDVVRLHDLADLLEVRVEKILPVVGETPFREDRPAARDDPRNTLGGERYVAQQHSGVNREVVDALLRLFDQRVAIELPG